MPTVRRLLAVAVLVALVVSGAALAARGDPQKNFNPADQARAKAMLLKSSELTGSFRVRPPDKDDGDDFYCRALDESDLTLTGERDSTFEPRQPDRQRGVLFLVSGGSVYESRADADASWRRGTSAAGQNCFRDELRRDVVKDGGRFISFKRVPFPRVAERTVAYQFAALTAQGVPVHLWLVMNMQSRAQAGVIMAQVPLVSPRPELERLSRIIGSRMKTAMRGA